jgi:anaerobic magnesium-protoporphyrin IX monomethyl ester cyclase
MPEIRRVLFVFPETRYPSGQPPLGLASLSAQARAAGCEPFLCDMSFLKEPFQRLEEMMASVDPDMVAVSVVTPQLEAVVKTAETVRRKGQRDSLLVIGGPHASVLPEDTLERTGADLVYSGEGDLAFRRLVETGTWDDLPGACWMEDGRVRRNPGLLLVPDLDSLPMPDRSIFAMEDYFAHWYSMDRVDPSLRGTSVMGTRGCPFTCTFCQPTLSEIFGGRLRKRSPSLMVDEIELLAADYRMDAFMFEDSTFIIDRDWVHGICDALIERKLDLKWCCNIRADLLTDDLLSHMKAAGLSKVNMGVESASQRVLDDIYDKGITVEGVRRALRMARNHGIFVQGYFMLGAPGETVEEMRKTIAFASREPFDDAVFDITTPFPHTKLWDLTKDLINRDYSEFDCFHTSVYELEGITPAEIERMKKRAFWRFYLHPFRILRTLRTALGPRNFRRTLVKARRV